MSLPASLQWVEVDLPGILSYEEEVLSNEKPICALERVRLDLSKPSERRGLFARLGARARQALIITEGLITYLSEEEVGSLAEDLAAPPSFQGWILDLASPGLLRMMKQRMGAQLEKAGIAFKFAPEQGPLFFARCGWKQLEVRSLLKTAAQFKRLPLLLRLMALLPESNGAQGSRPWGGACLLVKE